MLWRASLVQRCQPHPGNRRSGYATDTADIPLNSCCPCETPPSSLLLRFAEGHASVRCCRNGLFAKKMIESEVVTMPPGTYYVGDLGYVLSEKAHAELCAACFPVASDGTQSNVTVEGKTFFSDGRTVVSYLCPDGDGEYQDQNGLFYSVDSGWLGITLLEGLEEQWEHEKHAGFQDHGVWVKETMMELIERMGQLIHYDTAFAVKNTTDGRAAHMSFGHVLICTDRVLDFFSSDEDDASSDEEESSEEEQSSDEETRMEECG